MAGLVPAIHVFLDAFALRRGCPRPASARSASYGRLRSAEARSAKAGKRGHDSTTLGRRANAAYHALAGHFRVNPQQFWDGGRIAPAETAFRRN